MPLLLLLFLLADIVSIAYVIVCYYLFSEWYFFRETAADDYAQNSLYGATALLFIIFLGKFAIVRLLSKTRKGEDEPGFFHSPRSERITRPDGSIINIEYYGKDDGQPIIFIHGLNACIKNWYYQKKHFEKSHRIIMMDLPGLGKSTRPSNKDFSLEKIAKDLNAVIDHTGVKQPVLWGHSLGGMTILQLLSKTQFDSDKIKGIILEHTTYTNPLRTTIFSKVLSALEKPLFIPVCWMLIFMSPIIWIMRWFSYLNGNSHIMTRLLTYTGTQTRTQLDFTTLLSTLEPPAITGRSILGMLKFDVSDSLHLITTPALIIAAKQDRLTKPIASRFLKDHLPNAYIVNIDQANHQGLIERHKEVNAAAETFVTKLETPQAKSSQVNLTVLMNN